MSQLKYKQDGTTYTVGVSSVDGQTGDAQIVKIGDTQPTYGTLWLDTTETGSEIDATPTQGSNNLAESGGIYTFVQGVKPNMGTIDLSATWAGSASPYSQTVTVAGATVTSNSKVDIQPSSSVIAQLINDGCNALYIENNAGTLTCYAIGEKPTAALIGVQVSVTEVVA